MDAQKRIKDVNLLFLIIVLAMIVFESVIAILDNNYGIDIFMGSYALQLLYSQLLLALPAIIYLFFVRKDFKVLRFKRIRFSTILLCILIYICLTPILNFFNAMSMLYSSNVISSVMFNISDEVPFALGLLLVAILPCFLEEMVYRGIFYNTYREAAGFAAALMCGLLFGIIHGNLNQFTYAFVLGVVFALIVEATDSLWSTVICHALVNAFSVCYMYALPGILSWVRGVYEAAEAEGDTNTMNLLTNFFGGDTFTVEDIMGQAQDLVLTNEDILRTMLHYFFPAILGGVFVFLLLRHIARNNGRWEIMRGMFRRKQVQPSTANPVTPELQTEYSFGESRTTDPFANTVMPAPVKRVRIITWQLVAGVIIMCLLMAATELLLRLGGIPAVS